MKSQAEGMIQMGERSQAGLFSPFSGMRSSCVTAGLELCAGQWELWTGVMPEEAGDVGSGLSKEALTLPRKLDKDHQTETSSESRSWHQNRCVEDSH